MDVFCKREFIRLTYIVQARESSSGRLYTGKGGIINKKPRQTGSHCFFLSDLHIQPPS